MAGTATANITPKQFMWMSGYGGRNRPADSKLTDLWAKALVLEDRHKQRVVLVTLDLIGTDREMWVRIGKQLEQRYKLPRASVAVCSSHTHTGPAVGNNLAAMLFFVDERQKSLIKQYAAELEKTVSDVVGRAIDNLAPAQLRWGLVSPLLP